MTPRTRRLRWSVPALALALVAAAALAPRALAGSSTPQLPARTAAQLLAALARADVTALSGTLRTSASLGLPSLPAGEGGGGPAALLAGRNTVRLWVGGPDRQRLALIGDASEYDVVRNGRTLWTYDSTTGTATRRTLPATPAAAPAADTGTADPETTDPSSSLRSPEPALTPQRQARAALAAITPSTAVSVDRTARVAGRPAYQLVLTPRSADTLVGSVRVAVDAATSVPLRVQVYARGRPGGPAFETGFTDVSFAPPKASVFAFTPPRGATVRNPATSPAERSDSDGAGKAPAARTFGSGWATVVVLPPGTLPSGTLPPGTLPSGTLPSGTLPPGTPAAGAPAEGSGDGGSGDGARGAAGLLDRLATRVPQGRLITSRLLSVLLAPDGAAYVGAVPPAALQRLAAQQHAAAQR